MNHEKQAARLLCAARMLLGLGWDDDTSDAVMDDLKITNLEVFTKALKDLVEQGDKDIKKIKEQIKKMRPAKLNLEEIGAYLQTRYLGTETLRSGVPENIIQSYHDSTGKIISSLESDARNLASDFDVSDNKGLELFLIHDSTTRVLADLWSFSEMYAKRGKAALNDPNPVPTSQVREEKREEEEKYNRRKKKKKKRVKQGSFLRIASKETTWNDLILFQKEDTPGDWSVVLIDYAARSSSKIMDHIKSFAEMGSTDIVDDYHVEDKKSLESLITFMLSQVVIMGFQNMMMKIQPRVSGFQKRLHAEAEKLRKEQAEAKKENSDKAEEAQEEAQDEAENDAREDANDVGSF